MKTHLAATLALAGTTVQAHHGQGLEHSGSHALVFLAAALLAGVGILRTVRARPKR